MARAIRHIASLCRVGARSASATSAQLSSRPDSDLKPQVTRRSASFILSSASMSAGRMSPMLTCGSQLVQRHPDAQSLSPGAQNWQEQGMSGGGSAASCTPSSQLPIPGQSEAEAVAVPKANSFEAGSFLSLSPTMQWLQVGQLVCYLFIPGLSVPSSSRYTCMRLAEGLKLAFMFCLLLVGWCPVTTCTSICVCRSWQELGETTACLLSPETAICRSCSCDTLTMLADGDKGRQSRFANALEQAPAEGLLHLFALPKQGGQTTTPQPQRPHRPAKCLL